MANNTKPKKKGTQKTKKNAKRKSAPYNRKTAAKAKKPSQPLNKTRIIALIISIIVVIGVAITVIIAGSSAPKRENRLPEIGKETAWGIDVSSHNGKINWKKVSKKADFAFIRVGYRGYSKGEINADKKAKANIEGALKNGIPVGVYFYTQAVNEKEAEKEAEYLLKKIKGYDITLPVVIDFEYAYRNGKPVGRLNNAKLTKKEKTALINAFCSKVRKAGYTPGIYASSYIYRWHLNMKSIPDDVFIWVADYNGKVTYEGYYDIWQFSERGKCDGVSSQFVDTNYFYTKKRL